RPASCRAGAGRAIRARRHRSARKPRRGGAFDPSCGASWLAIMIAIELDEAERFIEAARMRIALLDLQPGRACAPQPGPFQRRQNDAAGIALAALAKRRRHFEQACKIAIL